MEALQRKLNYSKKQTAYAWAKYYEETASHHEQNVNNYQTNTTILNGVDEMPQHIVIEIEKMTRGGRTEVEEWQHSKDFRGEQYITKLIDRECVDYDFGLDSKCHSKQQ